MGKAGIRLEALLTELGEGKQGKSLHESRLAFARSRWKSLDESRLALARCCSPFGVETYGSEMGRYWRLGCRYQVVHKGMALL